MNGRTFLQSKAGAKRKSTSLQETAEHKQAIAQGIVQDLVQKLSLKDGRAVKQRQIQLTRHFQDWQHKLRLGWNLLFYGYGSKKSFLKNFGRELDDEDTVLLLNGWGQPLNLRILLLKIISIVRSGSDFSLSSRRCDSRQLLRSIVQGLGQHHLYLIVDGLDSTALRGLQVQSALSQLAALPQIHLVATVDHVNAPLIWNKRIAASYNFIYQDLTTFQPCSLETIHCCPLLTGARKESDKKAAASVLHALVPKARQIFQVLAEHQLTADGQGMSVHELFRPCRDRFLVKDELGLRAHLGEFRDHDLVQTKRSADGIELCYIPLDQEALENVLDEASAAGGESTAQ